MKKLFIIFILSLSLGMSSVYASTPSTPPLTGHAAKAGGTVLDAPIPISVLNIPLQDASGKTFTLGSLKGKIVIFTDFLTSCPDICPMTTVNMRQIGDAIASAKLSSTFASVEISVDPKRDSISRISAYQKMFGDNSWTVATSSASNLSELWKFFGVYTSIGSAAKGLMDWQTGKQSAYDVQHADVVGIIGPDSHWRWLDLGNPEVKNPKSSNLIPTKLMTYLSPDGKINLLKPQQPTWTTGAVYSAVNEIFGKKLGA